MRPAAARPDAAANIDRADRILRAGAPAFDHQPTALGSADPLQNALHQLVILQDHAGIAVEPIAAHLARPNRQNRGRAGHVGHIEGAKISDLGGAPNIGQHLEGKIRLHHGSDQRGDITPGEGPGRKYVTHSGDRLERLL